VGINKKYIGGKKERVEWILVKVRGLLIGVINYIKRIGGKKFN
jgi:hypothetical protein